ncbi:MAG: murein L,D-transpeptidase catalytic domain family protein [Desulfovermiculus sp.]
MSWSCCTKNVVCISFFFCLLAVNPSLASSGKGQSAFSAQHSGQKQAWRAKYFRCGLNDHLSYHIFAKAMSGRMKWRFPKSHMLTIIDFTQPSSRKRCFVIDLQSEKLLYRTYVAHGRATGMTYAKQFSNIPESYQSSLGFYRTAETYRGKHGYSLRLDGLESEINDLARKRAIVMHSAEYAGEGFLQKYGRLGRSLGCPALPPRVSRGVISKIKKGSCLFVYAEDTGYLSRSEAFSSPSG